MCELILGVWESRNQFSTQKHLPLIMAQLSQCDFFCCDQSRFHLLPRPEPGETAQPPGFPAEVKTTEAGFCEKAKEAVLITGSPGGLFLLIVFRKGKRWNCCYKFIFGSLGELSAFQSSHITPHPSRKEATPPGLGALPPGPAPCGAGRAPSGCWRLIARGKEKADLMKIMGYCPHRDFQ